MAAISAFGVTQHSQIFSLFFRNRIKCVALYQLHNYQALLNLRRGYCRGFCAILFSDSRKVGCLWELLKFCLYDFNDYDDDWARFGIPTVDELEQRGIISIITQQLIDFLQP